jgi:uncharacterized Zn-finger protein
MCDKVAQMMRRKKAPNRYAGGIVPGTAEKATKGLKSKRVSKLENAQLAITGSESHSEANEHPTRKHSKHSNAQQITVEQQQQPVDVERSAIESPCHQVKFEMRSASGSIGLLLANVDESEEFESAIEEAECAPPPCAGVQLVAAMDVQEQVDAGDDDTTTAGEPAIYPCLQCSKSFSRRSNLTRHHRYVHTDNPARYKCAECAQEFVELYKLKRHEKIHQ